MLYILWCNYVYGCAIFTCVSLFIFAYICIYTASICCEQKESRYTSGSNPLKVFLAFDSSIKIPFKWWIVRPTIVTPHKCNSKSFRKVSTCKNKRQTSWTNNIFQASFFFRGEVLNSRGVSDCIRHLKSCSHLTRWVLGGCDGHPWAKHEEVVDYFQVGMPTTCFNPHSPSKYQNY